MLRAAIEQHDDGDRLDVVGEERQLLPLAVVVDAETVARQVRHQPAARVGDGRVDGDGAVAAAERRRLAAARAAQRATARRQVPELRSPDVTDHRARARSHTTS